MIASKPRVLSIANAIAYGINALETVWHGPFNSSVSQKYQTIVTPNGISFSIWGVIFLAQAICVVSNLVSERRMTDPLIVKGVSFWYIAACVAQTAWSTSFGHEKMRLSALLMGWNLLALVMIAVRQYSIVTKILERTNTPVTFGDYSLVRFPFELHLGWIVVAFILNLNVAVVASGGNSENQLVMAAVSLAILTVVSLACLFAVERPQYTVPLVAAWAMFWMSYELRNPKPLIQATFSSKQIRSFFLSTAVLSGVLLVFALLRWGHNHKASKARTSTAGEEGGEKEALFLDQLEARMGDNDHSPW